MVRIPPSKGFSRPQGGPQLKPDVRKQVMRLLLISIIIACIANSCDDSNITPVIPQRTEPRIQVNITTAFYSQKYFGKVFSINITAYNHGKTITLPFSCSDHLGCEVIDQYGVVVYRAPASCDDKKHDFIFENGTSIQKTFSSSSSLQIGTYIVRGGLLEHDFEYPWAVSTLEVFY